MGKPSKTLLKDLTRKGPFSCMPARSCKILQDLAGFCRNLAQNSCKIVQDLARSCRQARKRTFSCKSILLGNLEVKVGKWANPNQLASKTYIGEWATCIATTDYKTKYLEGKKLAKGILFAKFTKFFPLQNFPLYGIILKHYAGIIGSGLYVASYASDIHSLQMDWLENMTMF